MGIFDNLFGKKVPDREEVEQQAKEWISKDYKTFVREENPEEERGFTGFYQKACRFSGDTLKIKASPSIEKNLSQSLMMTDLNVTADEVFSLTILTAIIGVVISIPLFLLLSSGAVMFALLPFVFAYLLFTYPNYLAAVTKIKANDETVKVVLYMAIYLGLSPQMEGALQFASAHTSGPIGRDLKKIIWDLQIRRFVTVNEAISSKITKWLLWDKEFVESMNLIQALSMEPSNEARKRTLDKALNFILDSTYEKMKDYARDLRTPLLLLHTMGITFPIMGLVMFPMISIFLSDTVNPVYLIAGYIAILPLLNYFYLRRAISKRPGAFSTPDISHHPDLPPEGKFLIRSGDKRYYIPVMMVSIILAVFIMLPGLLYFGVMINDYNTLTKSEWKTYLETLYNPKVTPTTIIYSLSVVWGIGSGLAFYFLGTSYQRIQIRNNIKTIEDEFQMGLFRLSDVMTSGMPVESALEETLQKYREYRLEASPMYSFFSAILKNIRDMGMTFKRAVFDPNYGVVIRYPSILIKDIMQIIVSSAEKSTIILSTAARIISDFLKRTKNVENMLKELLDEIAAAIQLQTNFIAPFICGIVGGMSTFIIQLLQKVSEFLSGIEESFSLGGTFVQSGTLQFGKLMGMIDIEKVIPAPVFQLVVGIYMIETVIILAYFLNGMRNGFDKTMRNLLIGKALVIALIFYSIVLIVGVLVTSQMLAGQVLSGLGGGTVI